MTNSRTSLTAARLTLAALAVAVLTLASAPAGAQDDDRATGAPRSISGGQGDPSDPAGPQDAATGAPQAAPADTAIPATGPDVPPAGGGVVVNTLGSVDGATVGLLDDSNGGLGAQMWVDAPRADLEDLLARIPAATPDPIIRDLSRRLLLTAADVPVGPAHRALITIRIERLLDAGMIDEAGSLAAKAQIPNDPDFARVAAEALLYAGRDADICTEKTGMRLTSAEPFWLELRAYCYAAGGDQAAADLTRSIMDAQGISDPAFATLVEDAVSGQKSPPGPIERPTALHIFLLRKTGLPITPSISAKLGTPANLYAMRDARNTPAERLLAGERIVHSGAASNEELKALADSQTYSQAQISNAIGQAPSLAFLARQSLLRSAASLESRPGMRLQIVKRADPLLNEPGPVTVYASFQVKNVAAIPPYTGSGELAWIAVRVLMLGGKSDSSLAWLRGPGNPVLADAGLALDIAHPDPEDDALALADLNWLGTHANDPGGWPAASALGLGLWAALGEPVSPPVQQQMTALVGQPYEGEKLSDDVRRAIDEAAADPSRRGECILRVLDAIGTRGIQRFAPATTIELVTALRRVGLGDSAKALAIEALLFGPPPPATPPVPSTPAGSPGVP